MVLSDEITAVWCETLDDITVIRFAGAMETAEFVQVKSQHSDQLWSVAQLCQRKNGLPGTSVLERSLANDRCKEDCSFRIVTTRGIRSELRPLSLSRREPLRLETIPSLADRLVERLPDYESPNGHNAAWWSESTTWSVMHDSKVAKDQNLHLLARIAERSGFALFPDQIESVYEHLLQRIIIASAADKHIQRNAGKFRREQLTPWLERRIKENYDSGRKSGSSLLIEKLEAAGLDGIAISTAAELRRSYRSKTLEPSYLQLDDFRTWEDKVRGLLNRLRANLDTGAISDGGVDFHNRSLEALAQLRHEFDSEDPPPDEILQGCMYHITALCQHRFVRPSI